MNDKPFTGQRWFVTQIDGDGTWSVFESDGDHTIMGVATGLISKAYAEAIARWKFEGGSHPGPKNYAEVRK